MMRGRLTLLLIITAASACSIDVAPATTVAAPPPAATPPPPTVAPVASTTTSTMGVSASCLMGDIPFAGEGLVGVFGEDSGDAAAVAGVRWSATERCERVEIDLVTVAGSPAATLGRTTAELRPRSGLLRITLPPEVDTTSLADTVVDTPLVVRAYVVRLDTGGLAIDLHLQAPSGAAARAFLAASPARIVVDLQPGSGDTPINPPRTTTGVVLLGPGAGPAEYPLRVTGYARAVGGELVAVLAPGTPDRVERPIAPTGGVESWGEFTTVFETGPRGMVELLVGDPAAEVGGATGLEIVLDLR